MPLVVTLNQKPPVEPAAITQAGVEKIEVSGAKIEIGKAGPLQQSFALQIFWVVNCFMETPAYIRIAVSQSVRTTLPLTQMTNLKLVGISENKSTLKQQVPAVLTVQGRIYGFKYQENYLLRQFPLASKSTPEGQKQTSMSASTAQEHVPLIESPAFRWSSYVRLGKCATKAVYGIYLVPHNTSSKNESGRTKLFRSFLKITFIFQIYYLLISQTVEDIKLNISPSNMQNLFILHPHQLRLEKSYFRTKLIFRPLLEVLLYLIFVSIIYWPNANLFNKY